MEIGTNKEKEIVIGGIYKHFKGDYYKVLTVGKDSEDLKDMVVYISLYYKAEKETRVWIRSLEDFIGMKELEDGSKIERFKIISNN